MTIRQDFGALGLQGVAGAGLLAFALAYFAGSVAPVREDASALREEAASLLAQASTRSPAPAAAVGTSSLSLAHRTKMPLSGAGAVFSRVAALAQAHALSVERYAYGFSEQRGSARYEVTLPIKGSYPALRRFLADVLAVDPTATLDNIVIRRASAQEPSVDASVTLSFRFAAP